MVKKTITTSCTTQNTEETKHSKKILGDVLVSAYKTEREQLRENLTSLRSQGTTGKELAIALLSKEKQTAWYKKSKQSYIQIVADLKKRLDNNNISSETLSLDEALAAINDYHTTTGENYDKDVIELIDKFLESIAPIFESGGRDYQYYDNYNHTSTSDDYGWCGFNCEQSSRSLDILIKFFDILPIEKQETYLKMALETTHFIEHRYTYYSKGGILRKGAVPSQYANFEYMRSYSSTGRLSDTQDLYSCKKYLQPLLKKVFLNTKNSQFINSMIVPLIHHGYSLNTILPKTISAEYLTEGNIKNILSLDIIKNNKAYLGEILLSLHKNGVNFSQEILDYCIGIMEGLDKERIPLIRGKTGFSDQGMPIQDVFAAITCNNQKNLLKNVYKNGKLDVNIIKALKKMYTSNVIREGIQKDCLNVEFINTHLDELSNILDNDGIMYVLDKITVLDEQKLDEKILKKLSIYDMVMSKKINPLYDCYDKSIEHKRIEALMNSQIATLVIKKINLLSIPGNIPGYALYHALRKVGILGKKHMEIFGPEDIIDYYVHTMKSIHSSGGTPLDYYGHERYKKEADRILETNVLPIIQENITGYVDSILKYGNTEIIKNIIRNDKYWRDLYRENMTKAQLDLFIDKIFENTHTQEDLLFLEKYVLNKDLNLKFSYSNSAIIYVKYRLYNEYPNIEENILIPASVYKDMILKGMVNGTQSQPHIIDDTQINIPNLEKIISLFEEKNIKSD